MRVRPSLPRLITPGIVRQLENTCRWTTVMASGREVHIEDLLPELLGWGRNTLTRKLKDLGMSGGEDA